MITDDNVYENNEQFSLQLTDLGGSFTLGEKVVINPTETAMVIQDNES